jgi:hypothetical protein
MIINANNFALTLFLGLVLVIFSNSKHMTEDEYKFLENNIEVEFAAEKFQCNSTSSFLIELCIVDFKFTRIASKTELDEKYKGVFNAQSDSRIRKADSDYLLAMQKCNSKVSTDKLMCERNAKIARQKEIDNANAQMKMQLPKAETQLNKRSTKSNAMPMIDDLSSIFKKSRLI